MNRTTLNSRTLLCLLSFTLVAPPILIDLVPQAEARAGRGSSMGSRGSRTYSAPSYTRSAPQGAQPMQRSMTTPPSSSNSFGNRGPQQAAPTMNRPAPNAAPQQQQPSTAGTLLRGAAAGAAGAAAYHMIAGGNKDANAQNPTATPGQEQPGAQNAQGQNQQTKPAQPTQQPTKQPSSSNFLIKIAILGLIVWFGIRYFRRRRMGANPQGNPAPSGNNNVVNQYINQTNIQLSQNDYVAFQQRLNEIQDAWNKRDLASLQKIATPEMVSYFNEQMTDLASRGLQNTTSNIVFQQGDLSEAWTEGNREYATVSMRYSLIDVTTDQTGNIVEGDPNNPVSVSEFWTFVRSSTNSNWWLLSAIQQTK